MAEQPQIQHRDQQPYAAIRERVPMDGIGPAVDQDLPEIFGWLAARDLAPAGPPLIRFLVIDMERELELEIAVPVIEPVPADGRIRPGAMPAGEYVVLRHVGHYDGLIASNAELQNWAEQQGVTFDSWDTPAGQAWAGRAEHYLTDPAAEPDPAEWQVDVAYLTRAG
jgi:effector-binding domain-containing protein